MDATVRTDLVGRRVLVEEYAAAYLDRDRPGGLFTGPAGIGKTALVEAIVDTLTSSAAAAQVVRVHASAALTNVPYGAMLPVVPAGTWPPSPTDLFERLRPTTSGRIVVAVDDIPLLDEGSLAVLVELVAGRHAFLLATARDDVSLPTAVTVLARSHGWTRRGVGPLGRAAIQELAERMLGGPLGRDAAGRLWERSGGSPLFARELVLAARATNALASTPAGLWELVAPVSPGARLADLVTERLGRVGPGARRLLELLAVAEPLAGADVAHAGLGEALDELRAAGLATGDTSETSDELASVRLAHPMYGDVVAAELGTLARRRVLRQAIDLLLARQHGVDRAAIRVARWQLEIGEQPDVEVLVAGARLARAARDFPSAEPLARAALDQTGSLEMRRIRAEALMHSGQPEAADAVAAVALDWGPDELGEYLRIVGVLVYNRLWYLRDPGRAREALDRAAATVPSGPATELLDLQTVYVLTFEGRGAEALAVLERGRPWSPGVAPQALLQLAQAYAFFGLGDDVLATARAGHAALAGAREPELLGDPALFDVVMARGLMFTGELAAAQDLLDAVLDRPEVRANPFPRLAALVTLGELAYWSGHLDVGRRAADEAASAADATNNATMRAVAFGHLATAAGQAGDAESAARLLGVLAEFDLPSVIGRDEVARGTAWCHVALDHPEEARRTLLAAAAESAGRSDSWDELWSLVDVARLGAAADVRERVSELCAGMTGALPAAVDLFVQALAGRTAAPLARACDTLAAHGADLFAAEAANALAAAHRRVGDGKAADAAMERVAELAARCGAPATPGLAAFDAVTPLSRREREVAHLAARGLPNSEIAARLGLSIRTVGNHLQNAYVKLGVTGRAELTQRLGPTIE